MIQFNRNQLAGDLVLNWNENEISKLKIVSWLMIFSYSILTRLFENQILSISLPFTSNQKKIRKITLILML